MKILWVCGSMITGGAERVTIQVLELLHNRGHSIEVLCPERSELPQAIAHSGFRIGFASLGGSLNLRACSSIMHALRRTLPSLALVTTSDEWVWASLAPNPLRTPIVFVRHMALPLPWMVRLLADRRARAIVAVSEAVRGSLLGLVGIHPELVHVIHNPVRFVPRDRPPTAEERVSARTALGIPAVGRLVGFFGGFNERKGIGDVIVAVRAAHETFGDIRLMVCGRSSGDSRSGTIEDWARELGNGNHLYYLGQIDRMQEAMTAADVVIIATHSNLKEGLPLTAMEAMACGTPVLAYGTGGVAEVLGDDGTTGRLVHPDDVEDLSRKLTEMLADVDGMQELSLNGLKRVREKFAPEIAAERYEQLFRNLIQVNAI